MDQITVDSTNMDLQYAIRQLRLYGDVQRALDALDRVEEALRPNMEVEVIEEDVVVEVID